MKAIEQMIKELCPEGVEFRKLKDFTIMKRGTSATKKTLKEGNVPVISGGMQPAYYCDTPNREGDVVTIAGSGASAGYVMFWDRPVFVCDAFSVQGIQGLSDTKFIYYLLKNAEAKIQGTQKGGGVPHVHISGIENFEFALPPLPIQQRIVEILDTFTALTAELQARQQQYEYYRDRLLTFNGLNNIRSEVNGSAYNTTATPEVRWVRLGEIATEMYRGAGIKREDVSDKGMSCVRYGENRSIGQIAG